MTRSMIARISGTPFAGNPFLLDAGQAEDCFPHHEGQLRADFQNAKMAAYQLAERFCCLIVGGMSLEDNAFLLQDRLRQGQSLLRHIVCDRVVAKLNSRLNDNPDDPFPGRPRDAFVKMPGDARPGFPLSSPWR